MSRYRVLLAWRQRSARWISAWRRKCVLLFIPSFLQPSVPATFSTDAPAASPCALHVAHGIAVADPATLFPLHRLSEHSRSVVSLSQPSPMQFDKALLPKPPEVVAFLANVAPETTDLVMCARLYRQPHLVQAEAAQKTPEIFPDVSVEQLPPTIMSALTSTHLLLLSPPPHTRHHAHTRAHTCRRPLIIKRSAGSVPPSRGLCADRTCPPPPSVPLSGPTNASYVVLRRLRT